MRANVSTQYSPSTEVMEIAGRIVAAGGRLVTTDGEIQDAPLAPIRSLYPPPASAFSAEEGIEYVEAPELERRAQELIARYREIAFLASVSITYLWKGKGGKKGGKARLGACQAASGLVAYFGETEFVIWLAADHCRGGDGSPALTEHQIEALLFHEMSHIDWCEDSDKAIVRSHDLEEFTQVVARYGLWLDDARMMADTIRQLELGVPA